MEKRPAPLVERRLLYVSGTPDCRTLRRSPEPPRVPDGFAAEGLARCADLDLGPRDRHRHRIVGKANDHRCATRAGFCIETPCLKAKQPEAMVEFLVRSALISPTEIG
jgi:hypothetical protein